MAEPNETTDAGSADVRSGGAREVAGAGQGDGKRADDRQCRRPRVHESPWFWGYVFTCGAMCALLLLMPKYQARQGALEKQFRARVVAGQSTEIPGAIAATEGNAQTFIPLWPLFALFATIATVIGGVFVWKSLRSRTEAHEMRTMEGDRSWGDR